MPWPVSMKFSHTEVCWPSRGKVLLTSVSAKNENEFFYCLKQTHHEPATSQSQLLLKCFLAAAAGAESNRNAMAHGRGKEGETGERGG